jgi:hypothetical protein
MAINPLLSRRHVAEASSKAVRRAAAAAAGAGYFKF